MIKWNAFLNSLFVGIVCLASFNLTVAQTTYTWDGSTDTDFATADNWTPSGVPGSGDNIIIADVTNKPVLDGNRTVNEITLNASSTLKLATYTLTVSNKSTLYAGTIENGKLKMTSGSATFNGATLDCEVDVKASVSYLSNNDFKKKVTLETTYTSQLNTGGNHYRDTTTLTQSGPTYWYTGHTNPDSFLAPLTFNLNSANLTMMAYNSAGNYFADDVVLNNFSGNTGKYIRICDQSSATAHFAGDITLNVDSLSGDINFEDGIITHDGELLIGSTGYSSGRLYLEGYRQSGSQTVDLSAMNHNSLLTLGPNLELEGDFEGPDVQTTLLSGSHFKGDINIPGVRAWQAITVDGKARFDLSYAVQVNTGGNLFKDSLIVTQSNATHFYSGHTNPDTVLGPMVFNLETDENAYLVYNSSGNYYADEVTINNHSGNTTRAVYFGFLSSGSGTFAKDIILNVDSTSGSVIFRSGLMTHSGTLRIGNEGFHSGGLTLQGYAQDSILPMDLTAMDHNSALTLGPSLTLEGDFSGPDVKTTISANCHFKGDVTIPKIWTWSGAEFDGKADLTVGKNNTVTTGGNVFRDSTTITREGALHLHLGYSVPDTFYAPVTFNLNISGIFNIGDNCSGNFFAADVTLNNHSGTTNRGFRVGSNSNAGSTFNGDITMNVDSTSGYINFYRGTTIHNGLLKIGSEGYHSGLLTLDAYEQKTAGTIDLDAMDHNSKLSVQSRSEITADLIFSGSSSSTATISYAKFLGDVNIEAGSLPVTYSVFHGDATLKKTGSVNNLNYGNKFHGEATIENASATNYQYWGYNQADTFFNKLNLINTATSQTLRLGYNTATVYEGDIVLSGDTGNVIQLGASNANYKTVLNGDAFQTISINNEIDEQIYRLVVDKSGGQVIIEDSLKINSSLELTDGVVRTVQNAGVTLPDGVTLTGGSDTSHVEGTVIKVGNDAFTFPLGADGRYRPLTISAPSSTTDEFSAEYRDKNSNGRHRHKYKESTIHSIDAEGYWVFNRNNGSSTPEVTLGWDTLTCGVKDTSGLRMVGWGATDTAWVDLGKKSLTGDTLSGTLKNNSTMIFGELAIGSDTLNDLDCPYDPYENCPLPEFSFTSGCIGDTIEFTDLSTGDMTGAVYSWNFDDRFSSENQSSLTNPEHVFVSGGPFYVTLNIQGLNGCDLTYMDTVNVTRQLPDSSSFNVNRLRAKAHESFDFYYLGDGLSGQSYSWDMGDGTTYDSNDYSLYDTIKYSFDTAGVYFVKFYHWTDVNCKGVQTVKVTVNMVKDECVIADFGASVNCITEATEFNDRTFGDTEGATYSWYYHSAYSGYEEFSTEQHPCYTFNDEGPYEVTLEVRKDSLCWDRVTKRIHFINELRDTTELEFGTAFVEENDDITFKLDGPAIDAIYELDLGDGTVTTATDSFPKKNFTHDYNVAGLYEVVLTHGDSGCLSKRKFRIYVDDPSGSCPTVDAGSDTSLKYLSTYDLGGNPTISGGTSPFTTEWIPSSALDDSSLTDPEVSPRFAQQYVVQVDDNNSCTNFDEVQVDMFYDLKVSTVGFDTILDTYEKIRYSLRSPDLKQTVESGDEKRFEVGLPSSGTKEVRLLFHTDPSEVRAKLSFTVDNLGTIADVKLVETDAVTGAETKVTLGSQYYDLPVGGGITIKHDFPTRYFGKDKYPYSPAYTFCADEISRNYQEVRLHGENGRVIGRSRSYKDQIGRVYQTQSMMLSERNILAAQSVTDAFGRASVSSLSAPIEQSRFCYKDDFMESSEGVPYNFEDFDIPIHTTHPNVVVSGEDDNARKVHLGGEGTLGYYYSNLNSGEAFVPSSNFPMSRTEFYSDPRSRVKRMTMAGEHHRLGKGHDTKVFHLNSHGEFNGLIGNRTTKTVTVGPDGLEQIAYTDGYGRVKASCVSGVETTCSKWHSGTLVYNGSRSLDVHLPKAYNYTLGLPVNNSRGVEAEFIHYKIVDLETERVLEEGSDYEINETRYVSFSEELQQKSLFLRISFEYSEGYLQWYFDPNASLYSDPNGRWIPNQGVSYKTDYSNWTINEFYETSDLLKRSIQPEGIGCTSVPETSIEQFEFGWEEVNGGYSVYDEVSEEYLDGETGVGFDSEYEGIYTTVEGESSDYYENDTYQDQEILMVVRGYSFGQIEPCNGGVPSNEELWSRVRGSEALFLEGAGQNFSNVTSRGRSNVTYNPYEPIVGGEVYDVEYSCLGHCINGVQDCGETGIDSGPICGLEPGDPSPCAAIPDVLLADFKIEFEVIGKSGVNTYPLDEEGNYAVGESPTHELILAMYRDCECNRYIAGASEFVLEMDDDQLGNYPDGLEINIVELYVKGASDQEWSTDEAADYFDLFQNVGYTVRMFQDIIASDVEPSIDASEYSVQYVYNDLDQIITVSDIDQGRTEFLYNKAGQLRFYENAKQRKERKYFYLDYDEAGRPKEVGEYNYKADSLAGGSRFQFENYAWGSLPEPWSTGATSVKTLLDDYETLPQAYRTNQRYIKYDLPDESSSTYYPFPIAGLVAQSNVRGRVSKTWNSGNDNTTWYSYLYDGRVDWTIQYNKELAEYHITEYEYDDIGNVEQVVYKHGASQADKFYHHFVYDEDQRLEAVGTSEDGNVATAHPQAEYMYYAHGPLKRILTGDRLQGTDFVYTINGWLKSINSPNIHSIQGQFLDPGQDVNDLFGMTIDYFSGDYKRRDTRVNWGDAENDRYSGIIKSIRWNTDHNTMDRSVSLKHNMYAYEYDWRKWLTKATFGEYDPSDFQNGLSTTQTAAGSTIYSFGVGTAGVPNQASANTNFTADVNEQYLVSGIEYDRNGNITKLNRNGFTSALEMDRFVYNYHDGTNKLDYVDDQATEDFESGGNPVYQDIKTGQATGEYVYNQLGLMTHDKAEDNYIEYDAYNMPLKVYWDDSFSTLKAEYKYDEAGNRVQKTNYDNTGAWMTKTHYLRDAFGGVNETRLIENDNGNEVLVQQDYTISGTGRIGYYSGTDSEYRYELTDHLGNIRVSFKENQSGGLDVLSATDYYPFGMEMPGRGLVSSDLASAKGYQGLFAEKDRHLNWTTFDLRTYDSRLGRFHNVDPMKEFHSPFMAMGNNPLSFIDPTGGCTDCLGEVLVLDEGNPAGAPQSDLLPMPDLPGMPSGPGNKPQAYYIDAASGELVDIPMPAGSSFNRPGQEGAYLVNGVNDLAILFQMGIESDNSVITFEQQLAISNQRNFTSAEFKWSVSIDLSFDVPDIGAEMRQFDRDFKDFGREIFLFLQPAEDFSHSKEAEEIAVSMASINPHISLLNAGYVFTTGEDMHGKEGDVVDGVLYTAGGLSGVAGVVGKQLKRYKDYNLARNAALEWLTKRGFKAEKVVLGKFGSSKGKPIGMQSMDGKIGFRVEYDSRSGAHINVWFGKEKGPHFEFEASEETVNQIIKRFSR